MKYYIPNTESSLGNVDYAQTGYYRAPGLTLQRAMPKPYIPEEKQTLSGFYCNGHSPTDYWGRGVCEVQYWNSIENYYSIFGYPITGLSLDVVEKILGIYHKGVAKGAYEPFDPKTSTATSTIALVYAETKRALALAGLTQESVKQVLYELHKSTYPGKYGYEGDDRFVINDCILKGNDCHDLDEKAKKDYAEQLAKKEKEASKSGFLGEANNLLQTLLIITVVGGVVAVGTKIL